MNNHQLIDYFHLPVTDGKLCGYWDMKWVEAETWQDMCLIHDGALFVACQHARIALEALREYLAALPAGAHYAVRHQSTLDEYEPAVAELQKQHDAQQSSDYLTRKPLPGLSVVDRGDARRVADLLEWVTGQVQVAELTRPGLSNFHYVDHNGHLIRQLRSAANMPLFDYRIGKTGNNVHYTAQFLPEGYPLTYMQVSTLGFSVTVAAGRRGSSKGHSFSFYQVNEFLNYLDNAEQVQLVDDDKFCAPYQVTLQAGDGPKLANLIRQLLDKALEPETTQPWEYEEDEA